MAFESAVKAGGVDMPEKTDIHDWATPSGQIPIILPGKATWGLLKEQGYDMRWYVVSKPIPKRIGAV